MALFGTERRHWLSRAVTLAEFGEFDLASEMIARRRAAPLAPFPPSLPFQAKLAKATATDLADLYDDESNTPRLYEGLDDLIGADEAELLLAGLSEAEARSVLDALG